MVGPLLLVVLSVLVTCSLSTIPPFVGNTTPSPHIIPVPRASTISQIPLTEAGSPGSRFGAVIGKTDVGFVLLGGLVANSEYQSWSYNANLSSWEQLKSNLAIFGACSVQDSNTLYIYGSGGTQPGPHLYSYDIGTDAIKDLGVTGGPDADGLTCGLRNGTIYLFGGSCTTMIYKWEIKGADKKWTAVTVQGDTKPGDTKGASGLQFGDEFVMWGGSCTTPDTRVWRFNVGTSTWKADDSPSASQPDARSGHSAVIDELATTDTFIIFGGEDPTTKMLSNDTWVYNLPNQTWTQLFPSVDMKTGGKYPPPRDNAAFIYHKGRAFIFSGNTDVLNNDSVKDFWQLVITEDCYSRKTCDDCVTSEGCGWCSANSEGYQCIPGYDGVAFIASDCYLNSFSNDLITCPADAFPGWIVALIIVAAILVIGVAWYVVIRCQKKSGGYEQIN